MVAFASTTAFTTLSRDDVALAADVTGGLSGSSPIKRATVGEIMALMSDARSVKDRVYGAVGDGTTDDSAAFNAAIASAASYGGIYVPPGTYRLISAIVTKPLIFFHAPGATIQLPTSTATGAACYVVNSDNVTFMHMGIGYGQVSAQTNDTHRFILSDGYDNVRLIGVGQQGVVYGFKGRGIDFVNGDFMEIAEMRGSACTAEVFHFRRTSAGTSLSPVIRDCRSDGYVAIEATVSATYIDHPRIDRCDIATASSGEPGAEMWALTSAGIRGGLIRDCITSGPGGNSIGQSIARGHACAIVNPQIFNFQTGAELADCDIGSRIVGGFADCNGISSSVAATIDQTNNNGSRHSIIGFTGINFTLAGARMLQQSGATLTDAKTVGCTFDSAYASARGIDISSATVRTAAKGNTITVTGTAVYGIINTAGQGFTERDNDIVVGPGGTAVYVAYVSAFAGTPGNFVAQSSGGIGYAIQDSQKFYVGGGGVMTNMLHDVQFISANSAVNNGVAGDMVGSAGPQITDSGASVGSNVLVKAIHGYEPGAALKDVEFYIVGSDISKWQYRSAKVLADNPNTAWGGGPVPGEVGSLVTATSTVYLKTAVSTWTAIV